jgi:hypothetical protein
MKKGAFGGEMAVQMRAEAGLGRMHIESCEDGQMKITWDGMAYKGYCVRVDISPVSPEYTSYAGYAGIMRESCTMNIQFLISETSQAEIKETPPRTERIPIEGEVQTQSRRIVIPIIPREDHDA